MHSTPKVHKCKTIEEPIAILYSHYIEVFQPEYLKERQMISGRKIPIQCLCYFIENLLKLIVFCLITNVKDDWSFQRFLPISLNYDSVFCSCGIEGL